MKNNIEPQVTLVGAGPEIRFDHQRAKALAEANVVLYDALANEELLSLS
jgi:uroporphyrin-III C-methyltransferase